MPSPQPRIVSVSRRTDVPAYYADWLRQRMERGFAAYPNPHSGKPVFVDLRPESVLCFVFWTRNPRPLFKHLDYIDERYQKRHYTHFTINGLPETLEARNPQIDVALRAVEHLADRYGPDYVQWRFDPIVVSSLTPVELLVERFTELSQRLEGMTRRCYFSFVALYQKTRRNPSLALSRKVWQATHSGDEAITLLRPLPYSGSCERAWGNTTIVWWYQEVEARISSDKILGGVVGRPSKLSHWCSL